MRKKNQLTYWLSVIALGIALGLGLQFVRAWTEPTTAPPGGNVGAPINTGAQNQTKSAGLALYGNNYGLWATGNDYGVAGNDSDNGTWGALGYGGWGGAFHGSIYTDNYVQAYRYYDDDPNYYIDSNSESKMNKLNISRTGAGAYNNDTTLSLAESTSSTGKKAGINFHNGGVAEGQLNLDSGTNGRELKAFSYQTDMDLHATGVVQGDQGICIGNDCRSSWPSGGDNLGNGVGPYVEIQNSGEPTIYFHRPSQFATGIKLRDNKLWFGGWSTGDGTAEIVSGKMYDGNDTRYIVDPNGTSRMNYAITDNILNYNSIYSGGYMQAPVLCIGGDCRNSWPKGSYGCDCFSDSRTDNTSNIYSTIYTQDTYMNCGAGYWRIDEFRVWGEGAGTSGHYNCQ